MASLLRPSCLSHTRTLKAFEERLLQNHVAGGTLARWSNKIIFLSSISRLGKISALEIS